MCHSKSRRNRYRAVQPYEDVSYNSSRATKQDLVPYSNPPNQLQLTSSERPSSRQLPPPSYEQIQQYNSPIDPVPQINQNQLRFGDEARIETTCPVDYRRDISDSAQSKYENHLIPQVHCTDPYGHSPKTKYGVVGIIAGILFFPWGLFWTKCDSQVICQSCQSILRPKGGKCHQAKIAAYNAGAINYGSCGSGRRTGHCGSGRC